MYTMNIMKKILVNLTHNKIIQNNQQKNQN